MNSKSTELLPDTNEKKYVIKKYVHVRKLLHDDLYRYYRRGAYLIVVRNFCSSKYCNFIYGSAPYICDKDAVTREAMERSAEFPEEAEIIEILPTPKTLILDRPEIIYKAILGEGITYYLDNLTEKISKAYGINSDNVKYLTLKRSREILIILGITIENLSDEELKKRYGFDISVVTYEWLKEQKETVSDHAEEIVNRTRDYLNVTTFNSFSREIAYGVVGQPALQTVLVGVYAYFRGITNDCSERANILIVGASGCGKTQTFRELKKYIAVMIPELPVYQIDMSMVTAEGFKGKDTKYIVTPLLEAQSGGYGIVFVDEFDKRISQSYDSHGRNINGDIQNQILTLIEGRKVTDNNVTIDTNNTLFIFSGSFEEIRKNRSKKIPHVGFGKEAEGGVDHWESITRQDIIDLGASFELLGRIPVIANYGPLDSDALAVVAKRTAERISKLLGVTVRLSESMIAHLQSLGRSKYGCRDFETCVFEPAFKAYGEAMRMRMTEFEVVIEYNANCSESSQFRLLQKDLENRF